MRHGRFAIAAILVPIVACAVALGQDAPAAGGSPTRTQGFLSGRVTSAAGAGLGGVAVKLFEEGFLLGEVTTAAGGSYRLEVGYLPDIDWTLLVWFVPLEGSEGNLIPEIVLLRESLRSKELGLWSGCLPRLELQPAMSFDPVLMDEEQKLEQMSQMDCMKDLKDLRESGQ